MLVADHETDEAATEARIKRREIRERIARRRFLENRYAALGDDVARVSLEHDERVHKHGEAVAPLKAELAQIEAAQIKRIAAKQPEDEKLAARQRAILGELRTRKSELTLAEVARDRLIHAIGQERRAAGLEAANLPDEQALRQWAPERLTIALEIRQHEVNLAQRRVEAARERIEHRPSKVATAELEAATEALDLAQQRVAATLEEIETLE